MSIELDIPDRTDVVAERVARQADGLLAQQCDPALRHDLLTTVQARRAWRGEQTLDIVHEDADHELLTVHGQILIATDDLTRPEVADLVATLGLTTTHDDLVTVLTTTGDTTDALHALRAAGATATLHHVTLLSPVMKTSLLGPVVTDGIGAFPQYRDARAK